MTARIPIKYSLTVLLLSASVPSAFSQGKTDEKELKLNENAVKMIQFDFAQPKEESPLEKMIEAPMEKRWMKFKETVSFKRSFADTTTVKRIDGYVRAEPYTAWTRFGENPVYDVMPSVEKKWDIHWKLNPFDKMEEEYGHSLKPTTGRAYQSASGSAGVGTSLTVDFDKFFYEHFTARGRAIRHNRKYANAWKTYADYAPTISDSIKMPNFWKKKAALLPATQSVSLSTDSLPHLLLPATDTLSIPKRTGRFKKKEKEIERVTTVEEYIRQRAAEDSIRRRDFLRKDRESHNAYDVDRESRRLEQRRN